VSLPGASYGTIDALYLSPHLDDAALSCGGQIHHRAAAGERVTVVTVFAGAPLGDPTPLGAQLHSLWGLPADPGDALAMRRAEDDAALAVLGAACVRWDLVDAVYRVAPTPGEGSAATHPTAVYPSLRSLYAPRSAATSEPALLEQIVDRLRALPPASRLYAPLGVGRHVDHVLVRTAIERAFPRDARLRFYEELPYAKRLLAVLRARGAAGPGRRWREEIVTLGPEDLDAKCRAIACYASQLGPVYRDEQDLRVQVQRALRRGGERVWLQAGAP
jgi:LmbE family N-acetylglucosaminyl deacetylase